MTEPKPTDWQAYAQYHYKWNHFWGLLCSTAVMANLVPMISDFVKTIIAESGSEFLSDHVNAIASTLAAVASVIQYLPQLFVANFLETRERKKPPFVVFAVMTCVFLGSWSIISYFFAHAAPIPSLWVFCALYLIFWFFMGSISVMMTDVFGKAIPIEKRSGFWGNRFSLNNIMTLALGTLIVRVFDPKKTTDVLRSGYTKLFLIALCFFVFAYIAFYLIREPVHAVRIEKKAMWRFLADSFRATMVQDKNYRAFIIMRVFQILGTLAGPLAVLYLTDELGLPRSFQGTVIQWTAIINIIMFFLLGRVGNVVGSKVLLQISSLFAALACFGMAAIPFLAQRIHPAFGKWEFSAVVMGLYLFMTAIDKINYSAVTIARNNYPLDIAPATLRPTYIGFSQTVLVPFFLMQSLGGVIADFSSRQAVYVVSGVCMIISLIPSLWMQNVAREKRLAESAKKRENT